MTRQEITQVYYYKKEIELLEKKLAELEDVSLPSLRLDGTPIEPDVIEQMVMKGGE